MAWTSVGFDGTITEIQWAGLSSLLGNGYVAAGNGDCKVTAVAGARSVSVAAGSLYGDGVQSTNSGAETVALTTPVNGQWYLIVLRRTWASNTAALVAVAGATTSTTIPTSPPSTYPTINTNVGVLTDQPIAWAWCNSATTDVVVSDLRQFPVRTQESTGNAIINGDFSVNQRNVSSTNNTNGGFVHDRWRCWGSPTGGANVYSTQAFTPGAAPVAGYEGANYARLVTSGQSASTDYMQLTQAIEDVRTFAGQTITVSFWAKAASGTPQVALEMAQSFGSGGSPSSSVLTYGGKVTLSTVWARYSLTVAMPSISGKTLGSNANDSVGVSFWVSAGSNFNARAGSIGIQSNTFDFWGVQVEKGSNATPFRTSTGTKQGELAACQRYYYRVTADYGYSIFGLMTANEGQYGNIYIPLPVTMRTPPTYNALDWTGNASQYRALYGYTEFVPTALGLDQYASTKNMAVVTYAKSSAGLSGGFTYNFQAKNTIGAYLGFSAEL